MISDFANESLLQEICVITTTAGQAIMDVYRQGNLRIQLKSDATPVTVADLAANDIIVQALGQIKPTIMIISEESLKQNHAPEKRLHVQDMWLVDPLDGTKEFIKGSDEFTVNIALVRNHEPILGVVYAPALGILYAAVRGGSAWKRDAAGHITTLKTKPPIGPLRVVASRSHTDERTDAWLAKIGPHERKAVGSSLKLCYVADGSADVYPRFVPTMEWDTAAADAVLRVAGGTVVVPGEHAPMLYNKDNLLQPSFIAVSSSALLKELPTS